VIAVDGDHHGVGWAVENTLIGGGDLHRETLFANAG